MRHIRATSEIGSTLANHLRAFDETFDLLANLEPADDSPIISDGEILFSEIPAYDINKHFWSQIYTGDSNEETFLNSGKDTRNQSDCSLQFELRKPRITSSKCQRIFLRQRNVDTLYTEIINPCNFEDLPAKFKEALNRGENVSREHVNLILMW